jgi:hypothetical protein
VDSAEVLKHLEAELRALEAKRAELSRAIETIRRIIVVGKPEPVSREQTPEPTGHAIADRAIAYIIKNGGKAKMTDLVTELVEAGRDRHSQYGTIYGALKKRAAADQKLKLAEPGVWQYS